MFEKDLNEEINKICEFINSKVKEAKVEKLIVGLSGGIDSAVSAALSVIAIGKENVIGVMLPHKQSHPNSLADAIEVAKFLDIEFHKIDISPMVDAYFSTYNPDANLLRRGNRMARERMCVLYDLSAKYNGLVVGTGNKSELMIGYFTQFGDGACAFEPIGHLYKTEVFEIAKMLKLPNCVIDKKPTADLWEGQTDEEEIGIRYRRLDKILHQLIDLSKTKEEIIQLGFEMNEVEKVQQMVFNSEFKRNIPETL
ncbi:MAG: NAD+ synthase [Candidatus Cloacimonadota bacterium]|nr:NAD+ synthase [Candidatus Cloacimonadota bacterium]